MISRRTALPQCTPTVRIAQTFVRDAVDRELKRRERRAKARDTD
jgi:hypothetical protein